MTGEKLDALNRVIRESKKAPFYRARLPDGPLLSLADLKKIPLTTKDDLKASSPFGLLAVPREEIVQYHESSGTTGEPVSVWFTREDVLDNARQITRCGVGFGPSDIVLVRFPYALSAAAHMVQAAVQLCGACVVPAGGRTSVTPFPKVVDLMHRLGVTVLTCLSLQAVMIAEVAEMMGLHTRRDFPALRAICAAGETLPPGRRKLLEELWGVPVYDFYGMTEIGTAVVDCEAMVPHPIEEDFVFEILDDSFRADVPPGEYGHLVVTTLKKRATPMIRYVTGDRARFVEKPCACGRTTALEIRGRREDALNVGGVRLDLWDLDSVVSRLPCRRFWAAAPMSDGVRLVVEEERGGERVPDGLTDLLEGEYRVKWQINIVPKGTLYDRKQLFEVGLLGKPKYLYTEQELKCLLEKEN
ncbi:MAG: CoF synthetase [Bacillaceae bacterium G1]|nr:MAG: CoF synthetase [Bacillaceae bacterium G1]